MPCPNLTITRLLVGAALSLAMVACGSGQTSESSSTAAAATISVDDYVAARQTICDKLLPEQDAATALRIKLQRRGDLEEAAAAIERANHSHEVMVQQLAELPMPAGHEEDVRELTQLDRLGLRLDRRLPDAIRENDLALQRRLFEIYDRPNPDWAAARAALGLSLRDC